ncbi:DUF418 domain-containing protein [Halalkalibacillus sediminis]|nr:DUF418 domain-containing protein [Halalkalibacillus sediminis]
MENDVINPTKNRIESLDAVRGFSLLGILIVNLLSFHAPHFMYGGGEGSYSASDERWLAFIDMFIQASFYPLFSLMFGIGLYMMYEKMDSDKSKTVIRRRMFVLAGLGIVHGITLWYGDILLTYAVIGLVAILFIKHKESTLKIWAFSLLVIPTALVTWLYYGVRTQLEGYRDTESIRQSYENFTGSISDIWQQNFSNWLVMVSPMQWIFTFSSILPMFILGMIFAKRGWHKNPKDHLSAIYLWMGVSFFLFITFKIGPYFFGMPEWFDLAQDLIGGSFSSIFYFFALLIFFTSDWSKIIKKLLAWVGKLSLTNYVMQSAICFFVFYGVGLEQYGQLQMYELILIALLIYSFQILFSYLYLKIFRFGPLEWVYRSLTYGKTQPFLKGGKSHEV